MALVKNLTPAAGHCHEEGEAGRCSVYHPEQGGAGCGHFPVPIFPMHTLGAYPELALRISWRVSSLDEAACAGKDAPREAQGGGGSDGALQDREDVLPMHGEEGAALGKGVVCRGSPDVPRVPGGLRGALRG